MRKALVWPALLVFSLWLPPVFGMEVQGRVFDYLSGEPIGSVDIHATTEDFSTKSEKDGSFTVSTSDATQITLVFSKEGYAPRRITIWQDRLPEGLLRIDLMPQTHLHEEIVIVDDTHRLSYETMVDSGIIARATPDEAGALIGQIPGGDSVRRGAANGDPVLRGAQQDRLNLSCDGGMRVEYACPNRMDPPSAHIDLKSLKHVEVIKGPYAVRHGAVFGGMVNMVTRDLHYSDGGTSFSGSVEAGYETNGEGKTGNVERGLGGSRHALQLQLGIRDYADYDSAEGASIPGAFKQDSIHLKYQTALTAHADLKAAIHRGETTDALFPALPMDMDLSRVLTASLEFRQRFEHAGVQSLSARIYATDNDHLMTNKRREIATRMSAVTDAETQTGGARIEAESLLWDGMLTFGSDYFTSVKDGIRTRDMLMGPMAGRQMQDIVWADTDHDTIGVYAEYRRAIGDLVNMATGVRLDEVESIAKRPEPQFTAIYGTDLSERDSNVSAFAHLSFRPNDRLEWGISAGMGTRSPNASERYIYLFPLGLDRYDYLGNPNLKPEENRQVDLSFGTHFDKFALKATVFYSDHQDFISARETDLVAPRTSNVLGVKQFFNIEDATRYGGDLTLDYRPNPEWHLHTTADYVRGENEGADDPLPEMPPLEWRLGAEYQRQQFSSGLLFRWVDDQDRVSHLFSETPTESFSTVDLRGSYDLAGFTLSINIENLFDEEYAEHLSRKLRSDGTRIPEPGRSFFFTIRRSF